MRSPAQSYRDLVVWQRGMAATKAIYRATRAFPREELYGLTAQIRKSVVSIPSNVAEGFGRRGRPEYIRFLLIARGSLFEAGTQLEIAFEEGYLTREDCRRLSGMLDDVRRPLESLIRSIEKAIEQSS